MQSYSDLNLKCCDCKSTFTSATTLLQHFAEHVHKEAKAKHRSEGSSRKKKRAEPQVSASQAESGSESSHSRQESTVSASSDPSSDSCSHDQPKLAKFDLQKRLESCVGNLSTKQDLDSCSFTSDVFVKQEDEESADLPSTSPDTKSSEEYSPLKFCMITMEENDDGKSITNSSPKKVASRKQLLPKKIERKVEGLRKLAPKPQSTVVPTDALLQSPGKKKYACHLCTKVFGWSTDLKRHILVHTGERPFKCKTCQATFTRNFLLQKHQSKVHPCKPKEFSVKPEIVEMPNCTTTSSDEEGKLDPLKEEPVENNEYDDDEDEDKLIITEEVDEKPLNPSLSTCSSDSKWHLMPNSDRRCSDLKPSEMFNITPVKVVTM